MPGMHADLRSAALDLSSRPIDPALFDAGTDAADDFYRHVNGGWLDANGSQIESEDLGNRRSLVITNSQYLPGPQNICYPALASPQAHDDTQQL